MVQNATVMKRPADLSWAPNEHTLLQGIDIGYCHPLSKRFFREHQNDAKGALPIVCRTSGKTVEKMEEVKNQKLQELLIDGSTADGKISPCCFEVFGGAGQHAQGVIKALSKVVYPGHEDDPDIKQFRNAWCTRIYRLHTLALARRRWHFKNVKYHSIMMEFAKQRNGPTYAIRRAAERDDEDAQCKGCSYSGPRLVSTTKA